MLSGTAAQLIRSIDALPVHRLVGGIFLLMPEKDRVSCARPDEGVLARSRSWYEALGAHILAVSCLCGCDVSVTEAFELQGMKWRWNKGKEAAALGFFLVQQPLFVDVPCEPHRIEIVR